MFDSVSDSIDRGDSEISQIIVTNVHIISPSSTRYAGCRGDVNCQLIGGDGEC